MSLANGAHPCHPETEQEMKVSELIELLQEQDPDAKVFIMSQENWPFECSITGITAREEFARDDDSYEDPEYEAGTAASDVFIVEGQQLRYGSKEAWCVATK